MNQLYNLQTIKQIQTAFNHRGQQEATVDSIRWKSPVQRIANGNFWLQGVLVWTPTEWSYACDILLIISIKTLAMFRKHLKPSHCRPACPHGHWPERTWGTLAEALPACSNWTLDEMSTNVHIVHDGNDSDENYTIFIHLPYFFILRNFLCRNPRLGRLGRLGPLAWVEVCTGKV